MIYSRKQKRSDISVFSKLAVAWTIGSVYCCLSFDGVRAPPPVFSARLDGRDARRSIIRLSGPCGKCVAKANLSDGKAGADF
jgi:hypothetical protein